MLTSWIKAVECCKHAATIYLLIILIHQKSALIQTAPTQLQHVLMKFKHFVQFHGLLNIFILKPFIYFVIK